MTINKENFLKDDITKKFVLYGIKLMTVILHTSYKK